MPDVKDMLIKAYEETPPAEYGKLPLWAIQGLSEKDAKRLHKAFNLKTVKDLSRLKYIQWAEEIVDLAESAAADQPAASLEDKLIKKYEQTPPKKLLRAPLRALQGVSPGDEKLLVEAFGVKTIKGFANLRYAQYARELVHLSQQQVKKQKPKKQEKQEKTGDAPGRQVPDVKKTLVPILVVTLVIAAVAWFILNRDTLGRLLNPQPSVEMDQGTGEDTGTKPGEKAQEPQANSDAAGDVEAKSGNTYVIQKGDTLADISEKFYGSEKQWEKLYQANKSIIKQPEKIYPGQELVIPRQAGQ